jgi:hypothetical protein
VPSVVEVPKIERVSARGPRGSKYVTDELLASTSALVLANQGQQWIGDIIEPVTTLVRARLASARWKEVLAEELDKPKDAFKVRVYTVDKDKWTFAITLQAGV